MSNGTGCLTVGKAQDPRRWYERVGGTRGRRHFGAAVAEMWRRPAAGRYDGPPLQ